MKTASNSTRATPLLVFAMTCAVSALKTPVRRVFLQVRCRSANVDNTTFRPIVGFHGQECQPSLIEIIYDHSRVISRAFHAPQPSGANRERDGAQPQPRIGPGSVPSARDQPVQGIEKPRDPKTRQSHPARLPRLNEPRSSTPRPPSRLRPLAQPLPSAHEPALKFGLNVGQGRL
jgi:hypothetical protein